MKSLNISIIAAALLAAVSCQGFLREDPTTSLTEAMDTEYALEAQERGVIRSLEGNNMFVSAMSRYLQYASGLIHWGTTTGRTNNTVYATSIGNMNLGEISDNFKMYSSFYAAVNRCNVLIDGLEDSPVEESYKEEIGAEAKLYRALLYFNLVRLYGNVPLTLKGVKTSTDYNPIGRTSYNEVYAQIVKDCEDAFEGMRSPERVAEVTGTQGRPNKWAAKALLSTVYLQMASILHTPQNDNFYNPDLPGRLPDFSAVGIDSEQDAWQKAFDTAKDVIDNGPYRLAYSYADLFKWTRGITDIYGRDCWNLDERILMIQSTGNNTANYTATWSLMQNPPKASVQSGTSTANQGEVRPTRFFFQKWCEQTGGPKDIIGICTTDTVYVGSSDPRLELAMYHTSYTQTVDGKDGTNVKLYPLVADETVTKLKSLPYFRKYWSPTYAGVPDVADMYLLRLAEIYYVAAEASARLGDLQTAGNYVEAVHARARRSVEGVTPSMVPDWKGREFADADEFVTALIWDKLFELCGEGHEFYETRRYGATWLRDNISLPINEFLGRDLQTINNYTEILYGENFQYPTDITRLRGALTCEFPYEELSMNTALTIADRNDYSLCK